MLVTLLVGIGGFVALSALLVYVLHRVYPPLHGVPGPRQLPLVGNMFDIQKHIDELLEWQVELTETYGMTWTLRGLVFQPQRIITCDPDVVRHVLKTNFDNYQKGSMFTARFHDLLGDGIFNSDGEQWYSQRKTASHLFNVKNFKTNMMEVFVVHAKEVISLLENACNEKKQLNMHDFFHRFTLDSIGDIAFGYNINSLHETQSPFAKAFDYCQLGTYHRFFYATWRWRKWWAAEEALFRKSLAVLDDKAYEVIRHRKEERARNPNLERYDLLSLFMERTNPDGSEYSDKQLRDIIMNFIIAGRDTTAQNLSWTFYMLSQHPEVEAKLIEEVDEMFGGEDPTFEDIDKMRYGQAVIMEALRLYPSVPKDPKFSIAKDVLPNGMHVPAGCYITYAPYLMGRLENLWGPDAKVFRPERWLEEGATFKPDPFKYAIFQAGPRTCLGQHMAYLEAKTLTVMILQRYQLRLVPGQNIRYQNNVTLPMKENTMLMFVDRRLTGTKVKK